MVVDLLAAEPHPRREPGGGRRLLELGEQPGADRIQRDGGCGRILDDLHVEHGTTLAPDNYSCQGPDFRRPDRLRRPGAMGEGGEAEGRVRMRGGARRITVLVAIAALTLVAACSGSDDSSQSDADDAPSSSVAFEKLDAVNEAIPPGGGDDWLTYRDDFTNPASGLADFSYDTSSGTRGDGTYELKLDEPEDFISNSGFGGRSRRVTVQATVGSTGTATDAGFGVLCLRSDGGALLLWRSRQRRHLHDRAGGGRGRARCSPATVDGWRHRRSS